jgi:hypothetical protein
MTLVGAPIPKIAIENPVGFPNTAYRKPSQIIQPWYFGEPEMKTTCLWLKGLPLLQPTKILSKPSPKQVRSNGKGVYFVDSIPKGSDRAKNRSRTFQGIADAMATQWGELKHSNIQSSLLSFLPGGL